MRFAQGDLISRLDLGYDEQGRQTAKCWYPQHCDAQALRRLTKEERNEYAESLLYYQL